MRHRVLVLIFAFTVFINAPYVQAQRPKPAEKPASKATLFVDATESPRKIFHARLTFEVSPGPLTLQYPKWLPGEHGPTGPVSDLAGLKFTAGGKDIAWRRDLSEMYNINLEVPQGASTLEATLDFLSPASEQGFSSAASATEQLAVISWNQMLLYPKGSNPNTISYTASLKLPAGWKFGTALPVAREGADTVEFAPAPLVTLVDSPVLIGAFFRKISLSEGEPAQAINIAADSAAAIQAPPEQITHWKNLVAEANALFGAHHYRHYDFLLTLSNHTAHFGLEHHESSDNRVSERSLIDPDENLLMSGLLPHEMTHSWNGKYRRPAGLATPDYQVPMLGDLLWVYEGLTEYLGAILTPRSGLSTPEQYRELLADTAADMDHRAGRVWRPLQDTADAAQILYGTGGPWESWRRGVDFYPESKLIWLEADVLIRQQTQGKKSLQDFCKAFHGGQSGPPAVVPYTFDQLVSALNTVHPSDWRNFFLTRLNSKSPRAPLGGIEAGGWRVVYNDVRPNLVRAREDARDIADFRFSIGLAIHADSSSPDYGVIGDAIFGLPAAQAGIGPGMKVVAVNGRAFSPKALREALKLGKGGNQPLELLIKNGEYYRTFKLNYNQGEKYPHLERDQSKPDLLSEIIKPVARAAQ
jgi:predicted metalloprotease with PDZ domain